MKKQFSFVKKGSMVYVVVGILGAICVGVSILAVKVVKENRKMKPPKEDEEDLWS